MYIRKAIAVLQFSRPVNLLIMALTQLLTKFCIVDSGLRMYEIEALPNYLLIVIILATLLIAAGGNIYNDILDVDADRVNKPGRTLIPDIFTDREARLIAHGLMAAGVFIGLIAALSCAMYLIAPIFIFAAWLLLHYSRKLKAAPLVGNLAISLLSALTILLVLLAAQSRVDFLEFHAGADVHGYSLILSWRFGAFFMLFAFLTTLVRELVKDRQDIPGDQSAAYRTLAIIRPRLNLRLIIWTLFLLQLFMTVILLYLTSMALFISAAWMMILLLMGLLLMFNAFQLKSVKGCRKFSLRLKGFMFLGLMTMILIWIEWNGFGLRFLVV